MAILIPICTWLPSTWPCSRHGRAGHFRVWQWVIVGILICLSSESLADCRPRAPREAWGRFLDQCVSTTLEWQSMYQSSSVTIVVLLRHVRSQLEHLCLHLFIVCRSELVREIVGRVCLCLGVSSRLPRLLSHNALFRRIPSSTPLY